MAKKMTTRVRETFSGLAKRAGGAQSVAADALGAAASAATEVVMKSAVAGLRRGASGLEEARPRVKKKVRRATTQKIKRRRSKSTSKKKTARSKKKRR